MFRNLDPCNLISSFSTLTLSDHGHMWSLASYHVQTYKWMKGLRVDHKLEVCIV